MYSSLSQSMHVSVYNSHPILSASLNFILQCKTITGTIAAIKYSDRLDMTQYILILLDHYDVYYTPVIIGLSYPYHILCYIVTSYTEMGNQLFYIALSTLLLVTEER